MRKKSERQKLIDKCKNLIRELKIRRLGKKCQFCGAEGTVGLFHVLSVGAHPRLQLHEDNMLLSCWFKCHHKFHHDPYYARDVMFPKLKELLGDDYEYRLREIEREQPKLDKARIEQLIEHYKGLSE